MIKRIAFGTFIIVVLAALILTFRHGVNKSATSSTSTTLRSTSTLFPPPTQGTQPTVSDNNANQQIGDDDPEDPSSIQAQLNSVKSPYSATVTADLQSQAQYVTNAYLTGADRKNYPLLWPPSAPDFPANFTNVQIIASGVENNQNSQKQAAVDVYWTTSDSGTDSSANEMTVFFIMQNNAWVPNNVQDNSTN